MFVQADNDDYPTEATLFTRLRLTFAKVCRYKPPQNGSGLLSRKLLSWLCNKSYSIDPLALHYWRCLSNEQRFFDGQIISTSNLALADRHSSASLTDLFQQDYRSELTKSSSFNSHSVWL